jgi:hypothetical protein
MPLLAQGASLEHSRIVLTPLEKNEKPAKSSFPLLPAEEEEANEEGEWIAPPGALLLGFRLWRKQRVKDPGVTRHRGAQAPSGTLFASTSNPAGNGRTV